MHCRGGGRWQGCLLWLGLRATPGLFILLPCIISSRFSIQLEDDCIGRPGLAWTHCDNEWPSFSVPFELFLLPDCWFFTLSHGLMLQLHNLHLFPVWAASPPRRFRRAILRQSSEYVDKRKVAAAGKTYRAKWNYWWYYNGRTGGVHLKYVGCRLPGYANAKVKHISHIDKLALSWLIMQLNDWQMTGDKKSPFQISFSYGLRSWFTLFLNTN